MPLAMADPIVDEVLEIVRTGDVAYRKRQYSLALAKYGEARQKLEGKVTASSPVELVRMFYQTLPLSLGDCYVQKGHAYEQAISAYKLALDSGRPIFDPNRELPEVWARIARTYVRWGDDVYIVAQSNADIAVARRKYETVVLANGDVPNSSLYEGSFNAMAERVKRAYQQRDSLDPNGRIQTSVRTDVASAMLAALQRLAQIDANLNYLGYTDTYVPAVSFDFLQTLARSFAQFAAQANREYISYRSKAESDALTGLQLQQAAQLNRQAVVVEQQRLMAAAEEFRAARMAAALAQQRAANATSMRDKYQQVGWDILTIDAANAWSAAASLPVDDEQRQRLNGYQSLGIQANSQPRSQIQFELARQRGQRTYGLEMDRLNANVAELGSASALAAAQSREAAARKLATQLSVTAAIWRWADSARVAEAFAGMEISPRIYNEMADALRETARIYLSRATQMAFLMQQAYVFETGDNVRHVRFDYGDVDVADGLYAADFLLRDIDQFSQDRVDHLRAKSQGAIRVISLATEYPLEFLELKALGLMQFSTTLNQLRRDHPGTYNARVKQIEILFEGLLGTGGPKGALSCSGVSRYRDAAGIAREKISAPETMIISEFKPRRDFGTDKPAEQLRVFENIGFEVSWRLDLPKSTNDFDYGNLTDVKLISSYLCQYDQALAESDVAEEQHNPQSEAKIWFSLKHDFNPDEFFVLAQQGRVGFSVLQALLPRNHKSPAIRGISLVAVRPDGGVLALNGVRLWSEHAGGQANVYASNASGIVVVQSAAPAAPDTTFKNAAIVDNWQIEIDPSVNPPLKPAQSPDRLDLKSVRDIIIVFQYSYARA